jgi:phosphomevalonate kinase
MVILGEYAVLDGAGAIVAAVNRGVECRFFPGPELIITVSGGDDRFARAALDGAPTGLYGFSDWNPVSLTGKAGFGGSAAAVVAARLAAGLSLKEAVQIHGDVQEKEGGRGSGVDIFASSQGGVRVFPGGEQVELPYMTAIWSGASAKTGPRVAQYLQWQNRTHFVEQSRALVAAFAEEPILTLCEAFSLLCTMAASAGIDYLTPAHQQISTLAAEFGGAAKPSGAGGGDIAVALFLDPEAGAAFCKSCYTAGLCPIPVQPAFPRSFDEPA